MNYLNDRALQSSQPKDDDRVGKAFLIFSNESFSVQTFLNYPIYRSTKGIVFGSEFVSNNYIELSVINNQSNVDYYSGVASNIAWRAVN